MTLRLTLKKQWYDMILSGEKKEEYREIKPYWDKRFTPEKMADVDRILFVNGYASDAPRFTIEFLGIRVGKPNPKWSYGQLGLEKDFYILSLGNVIKE